MITAKLNALIARVDTDLNEEQFELYENECVLDKEEIAYSRGMIATMLWTQRELNKLRDWVKENNHSDVTIVEIKDYHLAKGGGIKH